MTDGTNAMEFRICWAYQIGDASLHGQVTTKCNIKVFDSIRHGDRCTTYSHGKWKTFYQWIQSLLQSCRWSTQKCFFLSNWRRAELILSMPVTTVPFLLPSIWWVPSWLHTAWSVLFAKMFVKVVFVMTCLYYTVTLTWVREWCFIRIICY